MSQPQNQSQPVQQLNWPDQYLRVYHPATGTEWIRPMENVVMNADIAIPWHIRLWVAAEFAGMMVVDSMTPSDGSYYASMMMDGKAPWDGCSAAHRWFTIKTSKSNTP